MEKEYDFSKGVRGKFYVPPEEMDLPIYLEKSIREFYYLKAREHGQEPSQFINDILQKDKEIADKLS